MCVANVLLIMCCSHTDLPHRSHHRRNGHFCVHGPIFTDVAPYVPHWLYHQWHVPHLSGAGAQHLPPRRSDQPTPRSTGGARRRQRSRENNVKGAVYHVVLRPARRHSVFSCTHDAVAFNDGRDSRDQVRARHDHFGHSAVDHFHFRGGYRAASGICAIYG
jgi:hypothetical protein